MTTRRYMLQHSIAVVAAALSPALRAAELEAPLIIDTHQHLWDLTKFKIPWLDNAPPTYRQSYRTEEYVKATRGLDVKAIYMEVGMPPDSRAAEAEYVVALCRAKTNPTVAAVIGGRPDDPGFEDYIRRFKDTGFVRGARSVLNSAATPAGTCLKDDFIRGIRFLGKNDLSFDLCMRPAELSDAVTLSEKCPDTRLILDHCGNADPKAFPPTDPQPSHNPDIWKRDVDALARHSNVICKISGVVANAPEKWSAEHLSPIVNHCLDAFGPDRVVFGGDWPVCLKRATLAQWIEALRKIVAKRPAMEQRKLWSENAKRLYAV